MTTETAGMQRRIETGRKHRPVPNPHPGNGGVNCGVSTCFATASIWRTCASVPDHTVLGGKVGVLCIPTGIPAERGGDLKTTAGTRGGVCAGHACPSRFGEYSTIRAPRLDFGPGRKMHPIRISWRSLRRRGLDRGGSQHHRGRWLASSMQPNVGPRVLARKFGEGLD